MLNLKALKSMKKVKMTSALLLALFVSTFAFADGADSNTSQSKAQISKTIDMSYTHFNKNGNVLLSVVPHNMDKFTIVVENQNGEVVYTQEYTSTYIQNIDLSHLLEKGIYTVVLSHNNEEYQRSKVIL